MDPTLIDAAALAIARRNMSEDDTVNRSEICMMLGLPTPQADTPFEEAVQMNLAFIGPLQDLKERLLVEHNFALTALGSNGAYRRVPPEDQAEWAQKKYREAVNREFAQAEMRIDCIDVLRLNVIQRGLRVDILNRLAKLRNMFRKRKID